MANYQQLSLLHKQLPIVAVETGWSTNSAEKKGEEEAEVAAVEVEVVEVVVEEEEVVEDEVAEVAVEEETIVISPTTTITRNGHLTSVLTLTKNGTTYPMSRNNEFSTLEMLVNPTHKMGKPGASIKYIKMILQSTLIHHSLQLLMFRFPTHLVVDHQYQRHEDLQEVHSVAEEAEDPVAD